MDLESRRPRALPRCCIVHVDANTLFPVEDGVFVPVTLPRGPLAARVEGVARAIDVPAGVSVYLRGGSVERVVPHPRADIDLVVVGPLAARAVGAMLQRALHGEGRPVEVTHLSYSELADDVVHRVLLSTRARCVTGLPLELQLVPATDAVVWAFWQRYSAFVVTPRAGTHPLRRVCELKQLTRCYGVVQWFVDGVFTRDVAACLEFADAWAPAAAGLLRACWDAIEGVEDEPVGPVDVNVIRGPLIPFVRLMHAAGRR